MATKFGARTSHDWRKIWITDAAGKELLAIDITGSRGGIGRRTKIILDVPTEEFLPFARSVFQEWQKLEKAGLDPERLIPGTLNYFFRLLLEKSPNGTKGRPRKVNDEILLWQHNQWLATKSPKHGDREFVRRYMKAETEAQIDAAVERLRRARKRETARNSKYFRAVI